MLPHGISGYEWNADACAYYGESLGKTCPQPGTAEVRVHERHEGRWFVVEVSFVLS
jgi:hypothetical protein